MGPHCRTTAALWRITQYHHTTSATSFWKRSLALSHLRPAGPGGRSPMSAQSPVTTRGPPRACGHAKAKYIRDWEAVDFSVGSDKDSHDVLGAPALLA